MQSAHSPNECEWYSYDDVAQAYEELMVPHFFVRPAADLCEMLALPQWRKLLDVGTGTEIGALTAKKLLADQGMIVGLDRSRAMLRQASQKALRLLLNSALPGLPVRDAAFDAVTANFVLNHISAYKTALTERSRITIRRQAGNECLGQ